LTVDLGKLARSDHFGCQKAIQALAASHQPKRRRSKIETVHTIVAMDRLCTIEAAK